MTSIISAVLAPFAAAIASFTMRTRRRKATRCCSAFSVVWKGLVPHKVYIKPLPFITSWSM